MKTFFKFCSALLVVFISLSFSNTVLAAKAYKQCVTGLFGVGYVATVKWYDPKKIKIKNGRVTGFDKALVQTKKVAVFETKCLKSKKAHYITIQANGNNETSWFIASASAATIGIGGVALCSTAAAAIAPVCAEVVVGAAMTSVGLIREALPDPGIFWQGYAKRVEISGTVFNAKGKITKRVKGMTESYKLSLYCPKGFKNAKTSSKFTFEFYNGSTKVGTQTKPISCKYKAKGVSFPSTKITEVRVSTNGDDAAWIDYAVLSGYWSGKVKTWGKKGGKGYCLSTDKKDGKSWKKKKKIDKQGCAHKFKFSVRDGVSGYF
ncbi:MAG: hypothetical protein JKY81_00985 [Colwellia sp.]|nr:hypothetical protein [Colwellia sp.]